MDDSHCTVLLKYTTMMRMMTSLMLMTSRYYCPPKSGSRPRRWPPNKSAGAELMPLEAKKEGGQEARRQWFQKIIRIKLQPCPTIRWHLQEPAMTGSFLLTHLLLLLLLNIYLFSQIDFWAPRKTTKMEQWYPTSRWKLLWAWRLWMRNLSTSLSSLGG